MRSPDTRLRAAEREAQREPSPEASAAVLRERLRAGEACARCGGEGDLAYAGGSAPLLPLRMFATGAAPPRARMATVPCPACAGLSLRQRVELAAYAGDAGARLVLGRRVPGRGGPAPHDLVAWAMFVADSLPVWTRGLARWGAPVQVRAALAAARVAQVVGCYEHRPDCTRTRCAPILRALDACAAWLTEPTEERRVAAARALIDARPTAGALERAWLPCVPRGPGGGWGVETVGVWPSTADTGEWNERAVPLAARVAGEAPVRAAVSAELVAWALGGGAWALG